MLFRLETIFLSVEKHIFAFASKNSRTVAGILATSTVETPETCEIYKKPTIKIAECRTSILIVLSGTDFTPFCSVLIADFEKKK